MSKIVQKDKDSSRFAGKIEVTDVTEEDDYYVYKLKWLRFYYSNVNVVFQRMTVEDTFKIRKSCPKLEKGGEYIAFCWSVFECGKVRPYKDLTLEEWRLL
ncbi:hypothetical protein Y032_0009g544 [Ancylostoma ceylanicum]|nr:hypothetical protein Y032_0009g544 [Ancylostoma ceylanicum]